MLPELQAMTPAQAQDLCETSRLSKLGLLDRYTEQLEHQWIPHAGIQHLQTERWLSWKESVGALQGVEFYAGNIAKTPESQEPLVLQRPSIVQTGWTISPAVVGRKHYAYLFIKAMARDHGEPVSFMAIVSPALYQQCMDVFQADLKQWKAMGLLIAENHLECDMRDICTTMIRGC